MALKLLQPGLRPLGQFDLEDDDTITGGECVVLESHSEAASAESRANDVSASGPLASTSQLLRFSVGRYEKAKLCGLADEGSAAGYGTLFGSVIGGSAGQGVSVQLNTGFASAGSVVTVGPATHLGSGKVTVWHSAGLYAVDSGPLATTGGGDNITILELTEGNATVDAEAALTAADIDISIAANTPVFANASGQLYVTAVVPAAGYVVCDGEVTGTATRSNQLGIYLGAMQDSSSVSTPLSLAQGTWAGAGTVDTDGLGSAYASAAEEYVIYFLGNQGGL